MNSETFNESLAIMEPEQIAHFTKTMSAFGQAGGISGSAMAKVGEAADVAAALYADVINPALVKKGLYNTEVTSFDMGDKDLQGACKPSSFDKAVTREIRRIEAIEKERMANLPSEVLPGFTNGQVQKMLDYTKTLLKKFPHMKEARVNRKVAEHFHLKLKK